MKGKVPLLKSIDRLWEEVKKTNFYWEGGKQGARNKHVQDVEKR
jgi:hypothetical protein